MAFRIFKAVLVAGFILLSYASEPRKLMSGGPNLGAEVTAGTFEEGQEVPTETVWDSNEDGSMSSGEEETDQWSRLRRDWIYVGHHRNPEGDSCGQNPRCCFLKCRGPHFPLIALTRWMGSICQCYCSC
ncbi:Hypp7389 [Branchiostoma lanceolatum]|uniref:Hypp7389 protein n=1 Tax=Branchiostoma lanceolatum TaxID=7740 RepID=A0A8J9Z087_BRALA|nr:Hypp7389 [Branchiostoma lanceolatum]